MSQPLAPAANGEPQPAGEVGRTPLVSVVTPCYNAAPFVAETIESVRAQTYRPVEHVVVDDCSTDGSWDAIRAYGDRVRALRLERNGGGSRARNRGAALARGDYIMFLDADDLIEPGTIDALVSVARERPNGVAVCDWARLRWSGNAWLPAPADAPFPPAPDPLQGWLRGGWVPTCSMLWRRDAYERAGHWDETLTVNQDGELMMRALARGVTLLVSEHGRSYYRAHGAARPSVSARTFAEPWFRSQLRVLESVSSELRSQGRLSEYAKHLAISYAHLGRLAAVNRFPEIARSGYELAVRYGGREIVSSTWPGRLLDALVGVERKERIAFALARWGIGTPERRLYTTLQGPRGGADGTAASPRDLSWISS